MSVTATFQPSLLEASAGVAAALALCVHNDSTTEQVVRLKAVGELAQNTMLQSETICLEPGEEFEVPVVVDISNALPAGNHATQIEVTAGEQDLLTAEATIFVAALSTYSFTLSPARSNSASVGKHCVEIDNTGNTPIAIELVATSAADTVEIELAATLVNVEPGKRAKVELKVHPQEWFWNGDAVEHLFDVHVAGSDDAAHRLSGTFTQSPRFRPWFLPAATGALIALLLGSLAWLAVLQPQVESIADERAALANEAEQIALDEKIAELEAAAEEARSLPLGSPTDLRLIAEAAPGDTANESFTVASDRVLSVTDIVFQNPDGAVGRVALLRSGKVLLESELANFRDLDLHFVAPFRFDSNDTVEIRVDCQTPGPVNANCEVSATILGFIDQAD
jgi:hypothetical protein|tara:strand:+ start:100 stop:1284 length:1185 start_codon:yes stop_codon:yes gene_type:complete